jgi:hypothetical protein
MRGAQLVSQYEMLKRNSAASRKLQVLATALSNASKQEYPG